MSFPMCRDYKRSTLTSISIRDKIWKYKVVRGFTKLSGVLSAFVLLGTIGASDTTGQVHIDQALVSLLVLLLCLALGGAFRPIKE